MRRVGLAPCCLRGADALDELVRRHGTSFGAGSLDEIQQLAFGLRVRAMAETAKPAAIQEAKQFARKFRPKFLKLVTAAGK
jgi:hypothetical protein